MCVCKVGPPEEAGKIPFGEAANMSDKAFVSQHENQKELELKRMSTPITNEEKLNRVVRFSDYTKEKSVPLMFIDSFLREGSARRD
jgi:hypothetical protein